MPLMIVVFAVLNLAIGFALAVYLGAAPRFAHSRLPFMKGSKPEPSGFMRRLVAMLPKRKPSA